MIDIPAVNARLAEQDEELRALLGDIAATSDLAEPTLARLLTEGLCAIHERQGNLITLLLQSGR